MVDDEEDEDELGIRWFYSPVDAGRAIGAAVSSERHEVLFSDHRDRVPVSSVDSLVQVSRAHRAWRSPRVEGSSLSRYLGM